MGRKISTDPSSTHIDTVPSLTAVFQTVDGNLFNTAYARAPGLRFRVRDMVGVAGELIAIGTLRSSGATAETPSDQLTWGYGIGNIASNGTADTILTTNFNIESSVMTDQNIVVGDLAQSAAFSSGTLADLVDEDLTTFAAIANGITCDITITKNFQYGDVLAIAFALRSGVGGADNALISVIANGVTLFTQNKTGIGARTIIPNYVSVVLPECTSCIVRLTRNAAAAAAYVRLYEINYFPASQRDVVIFEE